MSDLWKTIKYLYFLGVSLLSLSSLYLIWIWRNGMLDPVTTTEIIMDDLEYLGPWAILIDIFILSLVVFFFKKSRSKSIPTNPWLDGGPNFGPLLVESEMMQLPPPPPSLEELELMGILKE